MDFNTELLLIDKPSGITSFDVIRRLRRYYTEQTGEKAPKLGHAGTLDPLATGLMLIGVGKGTKQLTNLTKLDKEYLAEVRLGERRTTGDLEGEILEEKVVNEEVESLRLKIASVLSNMQGELSLPVSAYSAIKVDGVPMYKRARKAEQRGEVVEVVPERVMHVLEADLENVTLAEHRAVARIRFKVGSGTYIRSLAEELGRRLGYPATLQNLQRTQVGQYRIEDAQVLQGSETK